MAMLALAACSSPQPAADNAQANAANAAQAVAPDQDKRAIEEAIAAIYRPYRENWDNRTLGAAYERPIYSARTTSLLQSWLNFPRKTEEQKDDINFFLEADYLCGCQDFDPATFNVAKATIQMAGPDKAVADVRLHIGEHARLKISEGAYSEIRFVFVKEEGAWRVDDLFGGELAEGLRAAFTAELAELPKMTDSSVADEKVGNENGLN